MKNSNPMHGHHGYASLKWILLLAVTGILGMVLILVDHDAGYDPALPLPSRATEFISEDARINSDIIPEQSEGIHAEAGQTNHRQPLKPEKEKGNAKSRFSNALVIDESGKGIAGAHVRYTESQKDSRSVVTDENGRFQLEEVGKGTILLVQIKADGYLPYSKCDFSPYAHDTTFRLQAWGELEIAGKVVDDLGSAVPDVKLTLNTISSNILVSHTELIDTQYSKVDGTFRFKRLPQREFTLISDALRGNPKDNRLKVEAGDTNIELVLDRHTSVKGKVLDKGGKPASKFSAWIRTKDYEGRIKHPPFENGTFEINDIRYYQTFKVMVKADGFRTAETEWMTAGKGKVFDDLTLILNDSGTLIGSICDFDSAIPIEGASVYLLPMEKKNEERPYKLSDDRKADVISKSDGSFRIDRIKPGAYYLFATYPDYLNSPIVDLTIEPGEVTGDVRLTVDSGSSVSGKIIVDELSRYYTVVSSSKRGGTSEDSHKTVVGKNGFYRLDHLGPGNHRLKAILHYRKQEGQEGSRTLTKELTVVPTGDVEHDFVFGDCGSISGRVFLFGEPIAGAEIRISSTERQEFDAEIKASHSAKTTSDENGDFRADLLPVGSHGVSVTARIGEQRFRAWKEVEVGPSETWIEFRLEDETMCRIFGYVTLDEETRANDVVRFTSDNSGLSTKTDINGFYSFDSVPPGKIKLNTELRKGYNATSMWRNIDINPGSSMRVDFKYVSGTDSIYGKAVGEPQKIRCPSVTLSRHEDDEGPGISYRCRGDREGRFQFDYLIPGTYTLYVNDPWKKSTTMNLSLGESREVEILYRLGWSTIEGTVESPYMKDPDWVYLYIYLFEPGTCPLIEGEKIPDLSYDRGLIVYKYLQSTYWHKNPTHDFEFERLPAGPIDVVAMLCRNGEVLKLDTKRLELPDGSNATVELKLID